MQNFKRTAIAGALVSLMAIGVAHAQSTTQQRQPAPNTSPMSATTANPEMQRQLAPSRRAMKKQKRAACEQQAKEQKLRLVKKWRFMRQCLKG